MKRETLIELTNKIESQIKNDDAYFGAFHIDGELESYLKANKNGLLKFIVLLLNSLKDFDFHLKKDDHFATINLIKENWFDNNSTVTLDWIEPTSKSKQEICGKDAKIEKVSRLKQKISDIIGFTVIGFIILSIMIGAFTILKFLVQLIF